MSDLNVIVAIGRDVPGNPPLPLDDDGWQRFQDEVRDVVHIAAGVTNARIIGPAWSPGWGEEESCWFAFAIDGAEVDALLRRLTNVRLAWGQEAIAVTVGHTQFV